jgi:copper chaperone CopZ
MNPLRHLLYVIACLIPSLSPAGDPAPVFQYKGDVRGTACAACCKQVTTALKKLPGVQSVTVTLTKTPGQAEITLTSTSKDITKASAIAILGDQAEDYPFQNFARRQPESNR